MKAWLNRKHGGKLEAVEIATPQPSGTEVVVDVTHCGLCHSDLHIWQGATDYGSRGVVRQPELENPTAMGHEIVGKISALGPDATGVAIGDEVIVYPWLGCGTCIDCMSGRENMCAVETRSIGFRSHGGFADKVVVPDARYLVGTGGIDPALAATYACSGLTVRSAIRKIMPLAPQEPVVVFGVGGLGLQAVAVLRALGHQVIVVVDIIEAKRDLALSEGAAHFVALRADDAAARVLEATGGKVAAVMDFVNNGQTSTLAFGLLRKGGKMVQVGLYGGEMAVPLYTLAVLGLSVMGSITGTLEDLRDVLRLAAEGKLKPVPVSTLQKKQINEAIRLLEKGEVRGRLVVKSE